MLRALGAVRTGEWIILGRRPDSVESSFVGLHMFRKAGLEERCFSKSFFPVLPSMVDMVVGRKKRGIGWAGLG